MNVAAYMRARPAPPHDPTSWRLDGHTGWHALDAPTTGASERGVVALPRSLALVLPVAAVTARSPFEGSGSLGGLRAPSYVALGAAGTVFLLDREHSALKVFDPCACEFRTVPHFGGRGSGRRQFEGARAIGIHGGKLFVCDAGNHRVSVFALHGYVLLGAWRSPRRAALVSPWTPTGIAFDGQGAAFVVDSANGRVHRLTLAGEWTRAWEVPDVLHVAVDCANRVHAITSSATELAFVLDADGTQRSISAQELASTTRFPCAPFAVDRDGRLHLAPLCADARDRSQGDGRPRSGVFDAEGSAVDAVSAPVRYETVGTCRTTALDSEIHRCIWHRVILRGEVPARTYVDVATYASEVRLDDAEVRALPDAAWETRQSCDGMRAGEWDCLVRGAPGRYSWLKLVLRGDGTATPVLSGVEIEFPRISLRRHLPAVFGMDPLGADFTDRFLALFDTTLRSIESQVDAQARWFDPDSTSAERRNGTDFLSWLGAWVGLTSNRHAPEAARRHYLKRAPQLYAMRGTPYGLWRLLVLHLGMEPARVCCTDDRPRFSCEAPPRNCGPELEPVCRWRPPPLLLEHFKLRRWLFVGAGTLNDRAVLWGQRIVNRSRLDAGARVGSTQLVTVQDPVHDPLHVHAHRMTVFVPARVRRSDAERKGLESLLAAELPAHVQCDVHYVEPRFRIGTQSMIGFDSVIARAPRGVALGDSRLGRASVLDSPPHAAGPPRGEVGRAARIGTLRLA